MIFTEQTKYTEKQALFKDLYAKHIPDFNAFAFDDCETYSQRDCDTDLIGGEIKSVEILADVKGGEGWGYEDYIVFSYEDNNYKCFYRDGSHNSGYNFYYETLVSVKPVEKTIIVYENY